MVVNPVCNIVSMHSRHLAAPADIVYNKASTEDPNGGRVGVETNPWRSLAQDVVSSAQAAPTKDIENGSKDHQFESTKHIGDFGGGRLWWSVTRQYHTTASYLCGSGNNAGYDSNRGKARIRRVHSGGNGLEKRYQLAHRLWVNGITK